MSIAVGALGESPSQSELSLILEALVSVGTPALPKLLDAARSRLLYQRTLAPIAMRAIWENTHSKHALLALARSYPYPDAGPEAAIILQRIAQTNETGPWSEEQLLLVVRKIGDDFDLTGMKGLLRKVSRAYRRGGRWTVDQAREVGDTSTGVDDYWATTLEDYLNK